MDLGRNIRRLLNRTKPCILMYHRVADVACDPWGLSVSANNFASQIERIARHKIILPMNEFATCLADGKLPHKAVAITFDDGYLDNLTAAAPILQRFRAPATLFLATGAMGDRAYWWDELAGIVLDPTPLHGSVMIGGRPTQVALGLASAADAELLGWRAWHAPRSTRQATYYQLWRDIRALPPPAINAALAGLRELRGGVQDSAARPMSLAEVKRLAAETGFSLAGHTVDHPDLTSMPDEEASRQMLQGRQQITSLVGAGVAGFAYPYGRVDDRIRRLAESTGFEWACTTQGGFVGRGCDRFALPRLTAVDQPDTGWTGDAPRR